MNISHTSRVAGLFCCLVLTACFGGQNPPPVSEDPPTEVDTTETVTGETKNVSYTGTVKPAGISIYMEGTHRLVLDDQRFILLESDTVDLNGYVGETVVAQGAIRPTVEADAMIMRVTEMSLQKVEVAEDDAVDADDSPTPEAPDDTDEPSEPVEEPNTPELETSDDDFALIDAPDNGDIPKTAGHEERLKAMARQNYAAENWTYEYCTVHIGFCVPSHKNWWFTSFGATKSQQWHVEMSSEPIGNLGDGPLVVRLVAGTLASLNVEDGSVHEDANLVVGYRSWTGDRHFEIIADQSLRDAVTYMTKELKVHSE